MSDFQDFLKSRILRHPTTWAMVSICAIYGGVVAIVMDATNVWLRQLTVIALYIGVSWLSQFI